MSLCDGREFFCDRQRADEFISVSLSMSIKSVQIYPGLPGKATTIQV